MTLNHVHFQVRDLPAAVDWFALVLELKPGVQNECIATFIFGAMTIIIDAGLLILRRRLGSKAMTAIAISRWS
jgi:hypothetical protein